MQSISVLTLTVIATAALASSRFAVLAGVHSSAGGNSLGVTRSDAAIGEAVGVDVLGTAVVDAGGTFAVGDELEVDAAGKAVIQSAGVVVARAVTAGAADSTCEVLLIQN